MTLREKVHIFSLKETDYVTSVDIMTKNQWADKKLFFPDLC